MSEQKDSQLTGAALLKNAYLNKDTAFTLSEREQLGLEGLLPPHVETIEEQVGRCFEAMNRKQTDLAKHIYLRSLQDSNETLFYRFVKSYITDIMPLIYTPVVGDACKQFSHIYRKPRGLFLSYSYKGHIERVLQNLPNQSDVKVIVVTDGERILGLGDQGVDGMGIPIGKLSLYTACGGIAPHNTLPIVLDVGTNNVERRSDPDYLGLRHERITGDAYYAFVDEFVAAVKKTFPGVLLQFEDFAQTHANALLQRYRNQLLTFNDDIQGTAAVAVSALLAATNVAGLTLSKQRIAVLGAGSAGCGICEMLIKAMMREGVSEATAREQFYLVDRFGLLDDSMTNLFDFQQAFVRKQAHLSDWSQETPGVVSLKDVIDNVKPAILLGVSGQPGQFSESIVKAMAKNTQRPIIFPMSNPTSRCEAEPQNLLEWTEGQALVATGSPFADVAYQGRSYSIAQSNNSYIFPGLGLGVVAVKARYISDEMFMAASLALAELSPALKDKTASLLPPLESIEDISRHIAFQVASMAVEQGHADKLSVAAIQSAIDNTFWHADY